MYQGIKTLLTCMMIAVIMLIINNNTATAESAGDRVPSVAYELSAVRLDNGNVQISAFFRESPLQYGWEEILIPQIQAFSTVKNQLAAPDESTARDVENGSVPLSESDGKQVFWASGRKQRVYLPCKMLNDGWMCSAVVSEKFMQDKLLGNFFVISGRDKAARLQYGAWINDDAVVSNGDYKGMKNPKAVVTKEFLDKIRNNKNLSKKEKDDQIDFFSNLRSATKSEDGKPVPIGFYAIDYQSTSAEQARLQSSATPDEQAELARRNQNN